MIEAGVFILEWVVLTYFLLTVTWFLYLGIMHLKKIRDLGQLTMPQKVIGYPVLFLVGLPMDVIFNWIGGTLLFLEIPREFLFTARCARHYNDRKTFRGKVARWACKHFLEPFDVGHCS